MTAAANGTRRPARTLTLAGLGVASVFAAASAARAAAMITGRPLAGAAVLVVLVAGCSLIYRLRGLLRQIPALPRPAAPRPLVLASDTREPAETRA